MTFFTRFHTVYDHLLDILTVVNKNVSNMEAKRPSGENKDEIKICKQMPEEYPAEKSPFLDAQRGRVLPVMIAAK